MQPIIKDQEQRLAALDASKSFIIQAPAGSGKTTLLTQRFLVLLAHVNAPEEVVAITFTRKAASEMRSRIIDALQSALKDPPSEPYALKTWQLARRVLDQKQCANWKLLQNPNRLRILTIDALCAKIAKAAPILSQFGTTPQIVEDAQQLYRQAAQTLLLSLNDSGPWITSLETVLLYLDNNYMMAQMLFVGMLMRRDQWLSHIVGHRSSQDSREILENGLKSIIIDTLKKAVGRFSEDNKNELVELCKFASENLQKTNKKSSLLACTQLTVFPGHQESDYVIWQGICELLLTKDLEWRRTININCGFPPKNAATNGEEEITFQNMKQKMLQLLEQLSTDDLLKGYLQEVRLLPPPFYSDKQWQIVQALVELLPVLVAFLQMLFNEQNVVDFIGIAQGAIHALGESENPSDLALNLDYRLSHLLIDEFQDTSRTQYRLIELLTAGWDQNDGRTLFLVGDPMQSIYRFREAEVGIFLMVKKFGLGMIKLVPLTLETNFRSQPKIIKWLNNNFAAIFPQKENIELGAIAFHPSSAINDLETTGTVQLHSLTNPEPDVEAHYLINLIKKEQTVNPNQSIAILVRSRNHLQRIIPAFKKENIDFQAIEIEKLINSPVVSNLFALTKALFHLGDRTAWLAILRAPWCGLTLRDLYFLANSNQECTLFERLQNFHEVAGLSDDGKMRLLRLFPVLDKAIKNRFRKDLKSFVAYTWYELGGPACFTEYYEAHYTSAYFQILEDMANHEFFDAKLLEKKLSTSFIHSSSLEANIHVLTIHKAKGLEYDTIIIPGLEKKPAIDDNQLLMWLERSNEQGLNDLILAPIKSSKDEFDPIYRYIRNQNNLKSCYEVARLLYVATTRAKQSLHLIGSVHWDEQKQEVKDPANGSFLSILWPSIKQQFQISKLEKNNRNEETAEKEIMLKRLNTKWKLPKSLKFRQEIPIGMNQVNFSWSPLYLNHAGTLIHHYLQLLSNWEEVDWQNNLDLSRSTWRCKLSQLGVSNGYLETAFQLVEKAIGKVLEDPKGRWILKKHNDAKSEYPLTVNIDGNISTIIMDRTFVDENGYRWIIDYKASEPNDNFNIQLFLEKAKTRYANQLENYAKAMQVLDKSPIKLGIYFPLFSGWSEWEYNETSIF